MIFAGIVGVGVTEMFVLVGVGVRLIDSDGVGVTVGG